MMSTSLDSVRKGSAIAKPNWGMSSFEMSRSKQFSLVVPTRPNHEKVERHTRAVGGLWIYMYIYITYDDGGSFSLCIYTIVSMFPFVDR